MTEVGLTYGGLKALNPCEGNFKRVVALLGGARKWGARKIPASQARDAGATFDDIIWAASAAAKNDKDIDRRLRLWMADCAARVLHIYENTGTSPAPRQAIIAARQYASGEIGAAARAAAWAAAWAAARDAAGDAAREAARASAWAAARDAAGDAAREAARAAARASAWAAAGAAARGSAGAAAREAETAWQFDRLVERLSDVEPEDWVAPNRKGV